jgi:DNA invertase Pin-like site-specific DNA recombinase
VIAAYVRVSSRSQTTDTQRDAISRAAKARGEPVEKWFTETKSAKTMADRPALTDLRDEIRRGGVQTLYVYRLDRLSRSGIRDTFALLEEFRGARVRIVTVGDGFTLDGPAADVVVAVLAWAAQMERLIIGERISDAHKRVKDAGGHWGRPNRTDRPTRQKVREMHENGDSIRRISIALKIPRATVSRVVSQKPPPPEAPKPPVKARGKQGAAQ